MLSERTYYLTAAVIFAVVAVAHFGRALWQLEAVVGGYPVPIWASWVAVLLAGYLAVRGFMFAQNSTHFGKSAKETSGKKTTVNNPAVSKRGGGRKKKRK